MSWDVYLQKDGVTLDAPEGEAHGYVGGTYVMGGTSELWLNVTYNYSSLLHDALGQPFRTALHDKRAGDTLPMLDAAIAALGDETDPDYWKPAAGNVKAALRALAQFARWHPDGVWRVS